MTNPTDGVPISEEFVRFADANAIGNAVLDALRSIPTVRRATGRTIPDLTKREHVCEYQSAVKSADPATPGAADRKLAEEIMRAYARKSGWSGDLAAIIAKHMETQRERTRRMEKALKRLCDLCSCNVLSPYPQPWGETTNDAVAEARAALVDSALKQEPKP